MIWCCISNNSQHSFFFCFFPPCGHSHYPLEWTGGLRLYHKLTSNGAPLAAEFSAATRLGIRFQRTVKVRWDSASTTLACDCHSVPFIRRCSELIGQSTTGAAFWEGNVVILRVNTLADRFKPT